jgi:hypothetical protein
MAQYQPVQVSAVETVPVPPQVSPQARRWAIVVAVFAALLVVIACIDSTLRVLLFEMTCRAVLISSVTGLPMYRQDRHVIQKKKKHTHTHTCVSHSL